MAVQQNFCYDFDSAKKKETKNNKKSDFMTNNLKENT